MLCGPELAERVKALAAQAYATIEVACGDCQSVRHALIAGLSAVAPARA